VLERRCVAGPAAREVFLHARPPASESDPGRQAEAVYRELQAALEADGGGLASVVAETVFLRDRDAGLDAIRAARGRVLAQCAASAERPVVTEVEQPPLEAGATLEVSLHAILPGRAPLRRTPVVATPAGGGAGGTTPHALLVELGDERRFYAAGLGGPGRDAREQTLGMFAAADDLLRRAGMDFRDVARTWIHLRQMDRDYAAFNRARRAFFAERGIAPVPASTGIGGAPAGTAHDLSLGVYAVRAGRAIERHVMTSPTLNEASEYGADFVRGLRVTEANRTSLYVSGTASIDASGRTAHDGDLEAQSDRMLLNIATLLERQGAGFGDVVHAVTYLKYPADAPRLRARLAQAGFGGFPHAMVAAAICRADLLCETEVLAVLPATGVRR
jgi:enamine deaminase RidA (YjgF/YER057c/UK114 family)